MARAMIQSSVANEKLEKIPEWAMVLQYLEKYYKKSILYPEEEVKNRKNAKLVSDELDTNLENISSHFVSKDEEINFLKKKVKTLEDRHEILTLTLQLQIQDSAKVVKKMELIDRKHSLTEMISRYLL